MTAWRRGPGPRFLLFLLFCTLLAARRPDEAAGELPRVRLLATGGTISNRTGGRLTADDLLRAVPDLERYVRADAEQFANACALMLALARTQDPAEIQRMFREY